MNDVIIILSDNEKETDEESCPCSQYIGQPHIVRQPPLHKRKTVGLVEIASIKQYCVFHPALQKLIKNEIKYTCKFSYPTNIFIM